VPTPVAAAPPSPHRRRLLLVLAGLWVLDGILKLQPYMFTKTFAVQTLGEASSGAPSWLASPISWAQRILENHPVAPMIVFALIEIAIGFGIAYRPTRRLALLGSLVWVPFLWFFAEGLGGLTTGSAGPLTGAPGASILYALTAVLLWPTDRPGTSQAACFIGERAAQAIWFLLWGLLAYLALLPANTAPDGISQTISGNVMGTPTWYTSLLDTASNWTAGRGGWLSVLLAVALALVAVSVWVPGPRSVPVRRAGVVLALVLAAVIWVFGEGLGMPFMGTGTDPDTGPLLALIAVVYWPFTLAPGLGGGTATRP
jgi:hypothetical protein